MKLTTGSTVIVRNLGSGDWGYLDIIDLYNYKGQYVVYGVTQAREVHVVRGVFPVKARPSCFAVLVDETKENISYLVKLLKGEPLIIIQGSDILYILNMGRLKGFWDGRTNDKDGMVQHAQKMIDLYQDWKRLGHLPRWFLDLKAEAQSGNDQLWTPG